MFWPEDVHSILSIPIKSGFGYMVAWHYDPKGTFSTKSAYHVLEDIQEQAKVKQVGSSSDSKDDGSNDFWMIWKVDCILKIKQFLWRFAHNSLPLRRNIARRGVETDTRCPVCGQLDEDGGNCFMKCKHVKKGCQGLNLEDVRLQLLRCIVLKKWWSSYYS